jgi:hypothetical protein
MDAMDEPTFCPVPDCPTPPPSDVDDMQLAAHLIGAHGGVAYDCCGWIEMPDALGRVHHEHRPRDSP